MSIIEKLEKLETKQKKLVCKLNSLHVSSAAKKSVQNKKFYDEEIKTSGKLSKLYTQLRDIEIEIKQTNIDLLLESNLLEEINFEVRLSRDKLYGSFELYAIYDKTSRDIVEKIKSFMTSPDMFMTIHISEYVKFSTEGGRITLNFKDNAVGFDFIKEKNLKVLTTNLDLKLADAINDVRIFTDLIKVFGD